MQQRSSGQPWAIRWNLFSTLEDLLISLMTDTIVLVSHTHQHMQEKTTCLGMFTQQVGLKISQKTKVMMLNVASPLPVKVDREDLPTTKQFAYLGGTLRHDSGAGSSIRNCLNKSRNALRMLNKVW